MTELTGKALLSHVSKASGLSQKELAIECGYYSEVDGKPRVRLRAFKNALLEAHGIELDAVSAGTGRKGRQKSRPTAIFYWAARTLRSWV
jgi:hypothetical protein